MTVAYLAQPSILEPIPAQGRYVSCQLRVGSQPQTALRRLVSQADGHATVVALGASLVRELGASIPGLKTFTGIEGARIKLPATPTDLLIWLRGTDRGELLIRSRHLETQLAPPSTCATSPTPCSASPSRKPARISGVRPCTRASWTCAPWDCESGSTGARSAENPDRRDTGKGMSQALT